MSEELVKTESINPFQLTRGDYNQGTIAIEESRAIAEAQGKLIIAKKFPRDQAKAYEVIMNACKRKGLASAAIYAYPRGGQTISGPSIRLAEELARAWGNIDYGIRELSQREGVSEMETYCWDLETNTMSSQKFTVKHERHTKTSVSKLTDPRDIYELTANNAGRRLRARILAILPPDLIEAAIEECQKTMAGNNDEPIQDRVKKLIKAFAKYGVTNALVEKRLQHSLDLITLEELIELGSIFNSIKDNQSKISEWFDAKDHSNLPDDIQQLNASISK